MGEKLFEKYSIEQVIETRRKEVYTEVEHEDENVLLAAAQGDYVEALAQKCTLNLPTLRELSAVTKHHGPEKVSKWDVELEERQFFDGVVTVIGVPYDGDGFFFNTQPLTFRSDRPWASVSEKEIVLTYRRTDTDGDALKRDLARDLASVTYHLKNLEPTVDKFNNSLRDYVETTVKKRRQYLLRIKGMLDVLGVPLERRADDSINSLIFSVPKKSIVFEPPKLQEGGFKPEPAITTTDYEEILNVISAMARTMELSPRAFEEIYEEDLRFHFLVPLNGYFKGAATGETFNFQGKTDILIRVGGKNVFVAECKYWRGETSYLQTIDQLLSYLSWRDTKAAVIVFNRNVNFTNVLNTIEEATPKHKHYKRDFKQLSETSFRGVFAQPEDKNREVLLTVLVFDVPHRRQ